VNENYYYKTVSKPILENITKEKGSKFVSYLYPILDQEELKQRLHEVKAIHPKATHHCYAFRLGLKGENYRANDDGEPTGSAGLPIYNQLLGYDVTNVLLIVVRYFGGTKLGVSGLVKVYKESAKEILNLANIVTKELEKIISLKFEFHQQNKVFTILNRFDAKILDFQPGIYCTIKTQIKLKNEKNITDSLSGIISQ